MVGFSSLLFLVPTWWSVLVRYTKLCDSCVSLCETGRAFVHAVSQLFFLLGSRIGNHSIYLQIDFCKTILSSRPLLARPWPPSLNNLAIHGSQSLPCVLWLCLREAVWCRGMNTGLGARNLELMPQVRLGTLEKSFDFFLCISAKFLPTLTFWGFELDFLITALGSMLMNMFYVVLILGIFLIVGPCLGLCTLGWIQINFK